MKFKERQRAIPGYVLFAWLTAMLPINGISQQSFKYNISGKIPGADKILLSADVFGSKILDSSEMKDGSFSFRGELSAVSFGTLIVEKKDKIFADYYSLFIEPGNINVSLYTTGRQAKITGSPNNNIATEVESANREFWIKLPPLYDSINLASKKLSELHGADDVDQDSVKFYQNLQKRMEVEATPFIADRNARLSEAFRKYPQSLYTAYYAMNSGFLAEDTMKAMYARFDDKIKASEIGKQWYRQLYEAQRLEVGVKAPDFSAVDMNGKNIQLGDLKGKYVLLDFWATWCIPCRASNPHLITLYNKYKDKGVEFIGIADDDRNIAGWKKAVKNDGIAIWPQLLRGRESANSDASLTDLAKLYMVDSYPTKILIDKEGIVVAQWTGDDELEKYLMQLF